MNNTIFPAPLKNDDVVVIVSPSGCIDPSYLSGMKSRLQEWGLRPQVACFADAEYGRFAGTDELRLYDLQNALDAPNVKAIFCSRGGYGCIHLVNQLNWEQFRKNPKWIVGYSDITILHAAAQHQGFASVHAPMARHFTEENECDLSLQFLKQFLFDREFVWDAANHPLNKPGKAKGILTGGNLSVLYGLRGTALDIIPENAILFIEDIAEKPYHVERMLYNLKLGGIFDKLSGLIVGQFTDYEEDPLMPFPLCETIADLVAEYDYPIWFDFPVGHVTCNLPMICGGEYLLEVSETDAHLKLQ